MRKLSMNMSTKFTKSNSTPQRHGHDHVDAEAEREGREGGREGVGQIFADKTATAAPRRAVGCKSKLRRTHLVKAEREREDREETLLGREGGLRSAQVE